MKKLKREKLQRKSYEKKIKMKMQKKIEEKGRVKVEKGYLSKEPTKQLIKIVLRQRRYEKVKKENDRNIYHDY